MGSKPIGPVHLKGKNTCVLGRFEAFRVDGNFCDVVLHIGSSAIQAHRLMLAAWSPYLESLLMKEKSDLSIEFESVEAFQNLVDFFYTGTLEINLGNFVHLLQLASTFQVGVVTEHCEQFFWANRSVEVCMCLLSSPYVSTAPREIRESAKALLASCEKLSEEASLLGADEATVKPLLSSLADRPALQLRVLLSWVMGREDMSGGLMTLLECLERSRFSRQDVKQAEEEFAWLGEEEVWKAFVALSAAPSRDTLPTTVTPFTLQVEAVPDVPKEEAEAKAGSKHVRGVNSRNKIAATTTTAGAAGRRTRARKPKMPIKRPALPPVKKRGKLASRSSPVEVKPRASKKAKLDPPADAKEEGEEGAEGAETLGRGRRSARRSQEAPDVKTELQEEEEDEAFDPLDDAVDDDDDDYMPPAAEVKEDQDEGEEEEDAEEAPDTEGESPEGGEQQEPGSRSKKKDSRVRGPRKLLKCDLCSYAVRRRSSFLHHVKIVHGESSRTFQCDICGEEMSWAKDFYIHMTDKHFKGPPFPCEFCGKELKAIQNLLTHRMTHTGNKPYSCNECTYFASTKQAMLVHMRNHSGERPFDCPVCDNKFATKGQMKAHMSVHDDRRPHLCDQCGAAFKSKAYLKAHRRKHTGDMLRCQFENCTFKTTLKHQLAIHNRKHLNIKEHVCSICGKAFVKKRHMVTHELIHTDAQRYKCTMCNYANSRKDKFREHVTKHHPDLIPELPELVEKMATAPRPPGPVMEQVSHPRRPRTQAHSAEQRYRAGTVKQEEQEDAQLLSAKLALAAVLSMPAPPAPPLATSAPVTEASGTVVNLTTSGHLAVPSGAGALDSSTVDARSVDIAMGVAGAAAPADPQVVFARYIAGSGLPVHTLDQQNAQYFNTWGK